DGRRMDLSELTQLAGQELADGRLRLRCCTAASCLSSDGQGVVSALTKAVDAAGLADRARVSPVGCMRLCCEGPLVQAGSYGPFYEKVTPADAPSIITTINGGGPATARLGDFNRPFFTRQFPIVLENCGIVEPERIETYLAAGGYLALHQALL